MNWNFTNKQLITHLKITEMNVKSLLLLLAFTGLGVSCSNDDLGTEGGGTTGPVTRSEIQIETKGSGDSQVYPNTKAIASEYENEVKTLDVYLFAAAGDGGPYYYLEKWTEGTAYDPSSPALNFKKQPAGTGWKASIYPNEKKGLPYIKLFCIANNTVAGSAVVDGKFYKEDGATELLAALTPVEVDADGGVTNAAAATTDVDFMKTFTKAIDVNTVTTPLLMTGQGQTKISGSVSKVIIDLRRVVARFDIDNNTSTSQLTIQKLTMAQGRKTGSLWGAPITKEPDLKANPLVYLTNYTSIDFSKVEGANKGEATSALYVYPTLATDESYLIIEGTYKSPVTSQQVPVTYHVPIVRTPADGAKGEYIPIKANNRYKLHITDVTQSNVFGTFNVEDWTSGGGMIIKPDNDAPVFAGADAFVDGDKPVALADEDGKIYGYEVKTDASGNGSTTVEIAATGQVRAEKGKVTKATETDWLTVTRETPEEKDGVWYTRFVISYTDAIGKQPVAVNFINESASYDPALWTTVNFYGPKAVPSFAVVAKDGASKGNETNADDPKAPTAKIYSVNNSFVLFDVTSIEGVEVDALTGYKAEEVKTEGFVHTYKISVSDEATAAGGDMVFKNAGDPTKTTTLKITKLDPKLAFTEVADPNNVGDYVIGSETPYPTTGTLKIDLDALETYNFKVDAPEGLAATNLNSCPWLSFLEVHAWADADGQRYIEYKVTPKSNPTSVADYNLIFTNNLKETGIDAPGLTITVHKDYSKPKLTAGTTTNWSSFNQGFASTASYTDPTAATVSMYKVGGSKITVKMNCTEAASFDHAPVTGLTINKITGSDDEYEISIADASAASSITGATTEVLAYNSAAYSADNATDRKAKLTITWVDPAVTFEQDMTADPGGVALSGDAVNITYADMNQYIPLTLKVKGYKGSTITYSTESAWVKGSVMPAEIGEDGTATIQFTKNGGDATNADVITITITNAITGGGDKTITLNKL